jgi:dTDP-4-amino-4,6-dideoxygalactose transaminase
LVLQFRERLILGRKSHSGTGEVAEVIARSRREIAREAQLALRAIHASLSASGDLSHGPERVLVIGGAGFLGSKVAALPAIPSGSKPNFHKFVVRATDREGLRRHLSNRVVDTRVHYAKPLHRTHALVGQGRVIGGLPPVVRACEQVLSLPFHPEMTDLGIDVVTQAVVDFYR